LNPMDELRSCVGEACRVMLLRKGVSGSIACSRKQITTQDIGNTTQNGCIVPKFTLCDNSGYRRSHIVSHVVLEHPGVEHPLLCAYDEQSL
jgi:hypothetical protein